MSLLSEAQLAANRRNAPSSKGRMSEEGKTVVRNNALRHGLTSKQVVLSDEDPAAFAAMREGLIRDHAPANDQEADLVDQIAVNYWRLLRAQRIEAGLFESAVHPRAPRRFTRELLEIDDPLAAAFCHHSHHFDTLRRYTASIERAYYRAVDALQKLHKARQLKQLGTVPQRRTVAATAAPASPFPEHRNPPAINHIGIVSQKPDGLPARAPSPQQKLPEISAA